MSRPAPRTAALSVHTTLVRAIKGTILLGAAAAGMAQAQQSPALDRVSISAGAFYADPEIHLGGDTRYGRVDTPDEEISDVTLPRVKGEVLIGDSHGISFDYFRFDEGYGADLKGDTVYEGRPVSGSLRADANLRIELARLSYKMWFGKEKNVFGVGAPRFPARRRPMSARAHQWKTTRGAARRRPAKASGPRPSNWHGAMR
jgi:hypothetical protein